MQVQTKTILVVVEGVLAQLVATHQAQSEATAVMEPQVA
jgi:hypothetical protein